MARAAAVLLLSLVACTSGASQGASGADAASETEMEGTDSGGVDSATSNDAASSDSGTRDGATSDAASGVDACAPGPGGGSAAIHTIGRFDTSDPAGPKFAWPGSTIVATFDGTGISAQLADNVGNNYFVVVVDGGMPTAFRTQQGTSTYQVATGLASGKHTVSLVKRTGSYDGVVQLLGLTPTGGALVATPEPWARRIEFIGDSITCGYGVLGGTCTNPSVDQEDWTVTAGALVATQLHAEPTSISYSGIGMYRDYSGNTTNQMPARFLLTLADIPTSTWGFTTPAPDVVVIDLGTNDFAQGDPGAAFQMAYTTFLQQELRPHYPNAWVILAVSPMLSGTSRTQVSTYLNGVVSTLQAAGDKHVAYFEYDFEQTMGCQYHPDVATNQAMAAKIVPFIEKLTGWCP
ncbi:MAG TPA: SGNH/GDSL hydrolase family protein [Polyangiaceae bacterium]